MKRYIPLIAVVVIAVAIGIGWRVMKKPCQPTEIKYSLVSDMILESLLAESTDNVDSAKFAKVAMLTSARFAPPQPAVDDRASVTNENRRSETNELAEAGIVGTCCCPCEPTMEGGTASIKGNLCPCPKFVELQFLAPAETNTEVEINGQAYEKKTLEGTSAKWEVFQLPEGSKLVDGDYQLIFKGAYFGDQTQDVFIINIKIEEGKAFLK